jgi:hypothetical protein
MKIKSNYTKLVDYLFWIGLIIFTNPGGILKAMGEDRGDGGINITDFLFVLLVFLYSTVLYKRDIGFNQNFNKIVKYLIIFLLYYFIFFAFLVPIFKETDYSSTSFKIIKSRQTIYSVVLFIMIYRFYIRSSIIFFNVLIFSSILIIGLFFITLSTGIEILPIAKVSRGFINVDRIFLENYGLMPILIPLGVVLIVFKINIKFKKIVLIAFGMMFLTWLLSLTRRHIFGTLIYFFLALLIYNYFQHRSLLPLSKIVRVLFYTLILGFFIFLTFPKYIDAGIASVKETVYVIEHGETTTGRKDERLGFSRKFLINLIEENPLFGTGFDNRWRTGEGDKAGYETSDYPLISAFAMQGVFGVLIFLPVYILLFKSLRFDINFFRKRDIKYDSFEFFMFMVFILYFVYDLMQYMNWFKPVSRSTDNIWYIYFAVYMASRHIYYYKLNKLNG